MSPPRLHVQHEQFPGIPAKALEFFHPRNAERNGNTLKPRTVYEFAMHLSKPTGDSSQAFPIFHRLNLILERMANLNLLMIVDRGGIGSMDASYYCTLSDYEITSTINTIDYAVYGFPVIYKELSPSVLPIVHTNWQGDLAIGTCFLRTTQLILTAKHCIAGAKCLSIRGISFDEFRNAKIVVHNNDALDLAAIHFQAPVLPDLRPIGLGRGRVFDDVLVMGYPNVPGFSDLLAAERAAISARITITRGAIASEATDLFAMTPLFLITARVRGGFSGGPVLSATGTAVGIVARQPLSEPTDTADFYTQYDNLGYGIVIPTEEVLKFLTACNVDDRAVFSELNPHSIEYRPL